MNALDQTDQCILLTLNALQGKYNKKYSFPSQKTILNKLEEFYGIYICKRTLNYHLAKLEMEYFIYRRRRITTNSSGCYVFNSTLYSLSKKAYLFITKLFNTLKNGYYSIRKFLHKKRISSMKEFYEDQKYLSRDENVRRLRELRTKL